MNKNRKIMGLSLLLLIAVIVVVHFFQTANIQVLNPKGYIAVKEKNLIVTVLALSLVIVIPVFTGLGLIIYRYRESNTHSKKRYRPNWDHSRRLEAAWWLFPTFLIVILSVISWRATHQLDPSQPIQSSRAPITIQVVSLDWKWLFIYPEQDIATVNYIQVPVNTPINFQITSDAPMNSFWVPQLGGQIYAMAGMSTQLHLEASYDGQYEGSSSNISGAGFSGMRFVVDASSQEDYDHWMNSVKHSANQLTQQVYDELSLPSSNDSATFYAAAENNLYAKILNKYMLPSGGSTGMQQMNMNTMETQ